jgi:hypothetical protein
MIFLCMVASSYERMQMMTVVEVMLSPRRVSTFAKHRIVK